MNKKRVLSIGQCAADHFGLTYSMRANFDVEVIPADSADAALTKLREGSFNLVLVNRLLDADRSPGLDVIKRIRSMPEYQALPIMLVSNYEEAQQEAVAAGAVPGFGKATMDDEATRDLLRPYLG